MTSPWHSLEDVPAHSAAAAEWKLRLRGAYPAVREAFLQKAKRKAASVQCQHVESCAHTLLPRGDGFVGRCKDDDGAGCDDIVVTADEAEVWEVNLKRLGVWIASALKCVAKDDPLDIDRTRQIASLGTAPPLPILLTVQHDVDGFSNVVARLVARFQKGFVLLAPSSRFCKATATDMLGRVNAGFFDLESHVELRDSGKLHAPKSGAELFAEVLAVHAGHHNGIERPTSYAFRKAGSMCDIAMDGAMGSLGRLKYLHGFNDIWFDDVAYDLRERQQARLCLQFLVENKAVDVSSARHFVKEIDPYVRSQGNYPRSADPKIDHYFNPPPRKLPKLRKAIIQSTGLRDGRYFLKVK